MSEIVITHNKREVTIAVTRANGPRGLQGEKGETGAPSRLREVVEGVSLNAAGASFDSGISICRMNGSPELGSSLTVGGITYHFVINLVNPFDVKIGWGPQDTMANLIAAINLDAGEDLLYGMYTTINPEVRAEDALTDYKGEVYYFKLIARVVGPEGDSIVVSGIGNGLAPVNCSVNLSDGTLGIEGAKGEFALCGDALWYCKDANTIYDSNWVKIVNQKGDAFTYEDFTPEQLEEIRFHPDAGMKTTGIDGGYFGECSLSEDFAYFCIYPGIAGVAIWKKCELFDTGN